MAQQDYYQLLGVSRDASTADIKKAYKKLAMKHHPDRTKGDKQSEDTFKKINRAYEVLSDENARARYDQFGHAGVDEQASGGEYGAGMGGFSDVFGDVFGDIFGGGQRARRGRDLQYAIEITLEEAVQGIKRSVKLTKNESCQSCSGTGAKNGTSFSHCRTCDGRGEVRAQQGFFTVKQTCPDCGGAGKIIKEVCPDCNGRGVIRASKVLSITIPPGVEDGDRMRVSGEGEAAMGGGSPGDLYVDIRVKPHDIFTREGNDLLCTIPVSFATLALGGEVQVPTLGGKAVLKVPEGTTNGKVFRLRGKGTKHLRNAKVGDLLAKLQAEIPVRLSSEQRELLEKFDRSLQAGGRRHSPAHSSWTDKVRNFFDA